MAKQKYLIRDAAFILFGALSIGLGLQGFLVPSHFIDGGLTGIAMLMAKGLSVPLAYLIPALSVPFIAFGWRQLGARFAIKSALGIACLAAALLWVNYPVITTDKLLTAVFGGFFIGAGIGLSLRGGAVLDGTDMVALLISKSSHFFRVGDVILILNIVIFAAAACFLGIEPTLYSVLTYLSASKTVDFIIHGIEEYTAVIIISEQSESIREEIIHELQRGVTVYQGKGGRSGVPLDILNCVVTRLEIGKIKTLVKEIDPGAFIVTHPLADAEGGLLKKRPLHT